MSDVIEKLNEYSQYAETKSERNTFDRAIQDITRLREENARLLEDIGQYKKVIGNLSRDWLYWKGRCEQFIEENARLRSIFATKVRPPFDDDLAGEPYAAKNWQPEPSGFGRVGQVEGRGEDGGA